MQHALATLLQVVQRSVRAYALLARGDRVLVAVSGGPDSTGLLLALVRLRRKLGIEVIAAHINHHLRGADADADEACAARAADALGVPFVRADLPVGLGATSNLEGRARQLRYRALRRMALEHRCTRIATGHTLDDQAETVLMRLLRGSGGRGLGAIRPRRADGVIRPLIECRRVDVAAVVRAAGLEFRLDQSNRDPRFLRTHVRERVLPLLTELNPSIARACANLAAASRAERRIVSQWADAQLDAAAGDGRLAVAGLMHLAPSLRSLLVRRWLLRMGAPPRRLTARHAHAVLELAARPRGGAEAHLPGDFVARRNGAYLELSHRTGRAARIATTTGD